MNKKISMIAAIINAISVLGFAVSMIAKFNFGSYLFSSFVAISFVVMMSAMAYYADKKFKICGICAVAFAIIYATIILLVYFAQMTSVRLDALSEQARAILDYQYFGLFFNYDLLGYAFMALSTFFAGLTVISDFKSDKALKILLLIHGIFFIFCFIIPMIGMFSSASGGLNNIGTIILFVWCAYFLPIDILSFLFFQKKKTE